MKRPLGGQRRHVVASVGAIFLVFAVVSAEANASVADETLLLRNAQFLASPMPAPPEQGWSQVSLPDNWRLSHPRLTGFAWYRIRFQLRAPPQGPLALYVPHISLAGEFWLNGSLLNPGVRYDTANGRAGSNMSDLPLYLVLPSGLFRAGENVLDIRLQGSDRIRSGLSAIQLAPAASLRNDWRLRYAGQVVIPYIVLVVVICASCFLGVHFWLQRRIHPIQFALLLGVLASVSYLAIDIPIDRGSQEALRLAITTLMFWLLCVVGYRMAGIPVRGLLPVLHGVSALTVAAALGYLLAGTASDRIWLLSWPHLFLRAVIIGLLFRRAWSERSLKYALLAGTAGLWLISIVQAIANVANWLPWDSFRGSVAGALPFCVVLLFFFASRFILDREEAVLQQRAAIIAERGRILQDMHDGMGAHLITALQLARRSDVDRGELARSIEESLQDLRLIIDSLDLTEHDLLPLLGNLRFRLEPRLNALGIRLEWDVLPPLPELSYLTPESALTILRIVQEAINNAIQHARPSLLRMTVKPESEGVLIQVADDGGGFSPAPSARGSRGMSGMRARAAKLGARLEIHSDENGTRVRLWLPRDSA